MKRRLVQTITADAYTFGQVSNPQDLIKTQDFLHDRISFLTSDFLNNTKTTEIVGFAYALGAGNAFNITIQTPGRIYAQDGVSYDLLADATLPIEPADDNFPRLDLIVAVLEDDVDAVFSSIPFVRLRTSDEFSNAIPPYPPTNINAPLEKHFRTTIQIKTGNPAVTPTPPGVASNEIPLYLITVAAKATKISDEDVNDLRDSIATLRKINEISGKNTIDIANLSRRVSEVEIIANMPVDLTQVFGQIRTLGDILALYQRQINALRDLPEVIYDIPKYSLTNPNSSKIMAVGKVVGGLKVVDIDVGGRINFGDTEVILRPENFADQTRNARFVQINPVPTSIKVETDLILTNVTQTAADGFIDFVERGSAFITSRAHPGAAARNAQFIEIFGGLGVNNSSALGDWLTYDVENDTLTPRVSPIPVESDRPVVMPCGDGINVLIIAASINTEEPRCFKLNAVTGISTEITSTTPTGIQMFGDLIAPNKIFIVAIRNSVSGTQTDFWEFNTITNQFTQLSPTGSIPDCDVNYADGCVWEDNQFVLVKFTPGTNGSGRTYIFDRPSLVWTELNIAQPYGQTASKQSPLTRFRLANVNGRPLLTGGLLTKETDQNVSRVWELTRTSVTPFAPERLKWQSSDGTFPPVQDSGFCSTLINGTARGKAFLFAGHGNFRDARNQIYSSIQGGLIATTYKGQPAVTIAESSSFVTFVVPVNNLSFEPTGYLISLIGTFDDSNLKVEVSFNDTNYHQIYPDKSLQISDSASPGVRSLRFTLYNLKSSKPILAHLTEVIDEDGADVLENRLVIRFDAPSTVQALYVNRDGLITLSNVIEPSTSNKCLLHKVNPVPSTPVVKNYINRRRPHVKYSKVKDSTTESTQFDNEMAVPVRYLDARAVLANNGLYKIPEPIVNFDAIVTVNSVANIGDTWIVEMEG